MTRTQKLHEALVKIAESRKDQIALLEYVGPRGGKNAKNIYGWTKSSANITRAGGLPMMKWWDGKYPTPATAIPCCCAGEAHEAERKIFG
jgi:hypothetical protein